MTDAAFRIRTLRDNEARARQLFDISRFKHALAPRAALKIRLASFASEKLFSKTQKSCPKNWGWQADFTRPAPSKNRMPVAAGEDFCGF